MNTGRGRFRDRRGGNRGNFNRGGGPGGPWGQGRGHAWGHQRGNTRGNRGFSRNDQPWLHRKNREMPGKRLSEEEIAVTEYLCDHEGFNGIIKSRYSDFQVSEINEKGEIAKLTDFTIPELPEEEMVDEDEDLLFSKYNLEILPMETWDNINKLVMAPKPTDEKVEIDVTGMSKEQRTKIHDAVKKAFANALVGSTITVDDKKLVRFERYRKGVRIDKRVKWIWPGEYLYFIVHKENCDTMEAAMRIAERLRLNIKPSMLGYAGTKDRRAKTSQWFSLRKIDPKRVADACRDMPNIHVGNYSFSAVNLKLGMLKGNQFRIALRNVTADDAVIDNACSLLRDQGFINYYGLQRFGVRRDVPTYLVGRKLLQGNFKEAIDCILEQRADELSAALREYRLHGPQHAARALPAHAHGHVEARVLKALAKAPNDLLGALNKMSRNTRLLYLHSYQSLVWNKAVSARLQRHGARPAVGDLVPLAGLKGEVLSDEMIDGGIESDAEDEEDESNTDTKEKTENQGETATPKADKPDKDSKQEKVPVKVLTQEDVDSGKYTIFDIVMPLPGFNIEYPPNMKEFFEEELKKDNLTMELRHKIKSYSMSGAYRAVAVRPLSLCWRRVTYNDPHTDLIASDMDELTRRELKGVMTDGKFKALLLTMSLPASCYATMALRELLKVDTAGDFQALQNNYHRKGDGQGEKNENGAEKRKVDDEAGGEAGDAKKARGSGTADGAGAADTE